MHVELEKEETDGNNGKSPSKPIFVFRKKVSFFFELLNINHEYLTK